MGLGILSNSNITASGIGSPCFNGYKPFLGTSTITLVHSRCGGPIQQELSKKPFFIGQQKVLVSCKMAMEVTKGLNSNLHVLSFISSFAPQNKKGHRMSKQKSFSGEMKRTAMIHRE